MGVGVGVASGSEKVLGLLRLCAFSVVAVEPQRIASAAIALLAPIAVLLLPLANARKAVPRVLADRLHGKRRGLQGGH